MKATQAPLPLSTDTLPPGTRVTSRYRGTSVGVVKGLPFRVVGERRQRVWVDYTASIGVVAIDYLRDLVLA